MFKFTEMLAGIQVAASQAAHAVSQENLKILRQYFVTQDSAAAGKVVDGDKDLKPADLEKLAPVTVTLAYPVVTANGVEQHDVYVPLISLAPINNLQVSTIEIEMDLEILEKDDQVMVGFPQQKSSLFGDKVTAPKPNAKIKITINSGGRTPGVTALIEGYDKALRAQVPG